MARNGRSWADPVIPLEWIPDPDHALIDPDGRIRESEIAVLRWSDIQRMRQGYVCAHCWEPQETPFPVACWLPQCRFPMRERQGEFLSKQYRDNLRTGPDVAAEEDQKARVRELRMREERENAELAGWRNTGTILVPRGISAA